MLIPAVASIFFETTGCLDCGLQGHPIIAGLATDAPVFPALSPDTAGCVH